MVQNIDDIQIHFTTDNLWLVNLTLALIMFGVALDIRISDFTNLMKSPKPVIVGVISQFLLIPLVTYLFIRVTTPFPSIALGLVMVGACPGGNISNFMTKLAGGNAALSVSLTAFASIAALVMTPLNFAMWGNAYEPTREILKRVSVDPMEVVRLVLLILGIPLVLGMLLQHYRSKMASRMSKFLKPVSILIFLSFIAVAFYDNLDIFMQHIHYVLFLVILHNGLLLLVGFLFARVNGLSYVDQKTLSIETGIQNSGLGLLLVFSFFSTLGGMALLVAFWAIWDIASGLLIAYFWSDKKKKRAA